MLLLALLALSASGAEPVAAHEQLPGRWYPNPYRGPELSGLSAEQREQVAQLEALGYLGGYAQDDASSGVTRWERGQTASGANLYSSGHAATALLVAMDGRVLHAWSKPFEQVFPELRSTSQRDTGAWRRVALRPEDGHLLAIYEGLGLVHLDARSQVVWASANRAHHDVRWKPGGGVLVLTRLLRADGGPGDRPLLEDCVAELDAHGREIRRVSVLQALIRSPWASLLQRAPEDTGDLLHTNALFPLDGLAGPAGPGDGQVLLSMRHLDALAVLDLDEERIVWAATGGWSRQHDVEITAGGAMMLFDNRGGEGGTSRVSMFEPWSMRPLWTWAGPPGQRLSSEVLGASQELPGGNVLVTESTRGRVVEVTPRGEIVWEYHNPHVTGPDGAYVAAIFEMIRLPASTPLPWSSPP
jgi:hypothetical protein